MREGIALLGYWNVYKDNTNRIQKTSCHIWSLLSALHNLYTYNVRVTTIQTRMSRKEESFRYRTTYCHLADAPPSRMRNSESPYVIVG